MKKLIILFFAALCLSSSRAQILNVPEEIQEQNQWCWAGSSNCILRYYGFNYQQCELAEWVRTVCTWHNYGAVDCCIDPSQGCNYWNYNYGYTGSIQDILDHFGGIGNSGYGSYLTEVEVANELSQNKPFVIRWGWYSGGGHFIVGHGLSGGSFYYMDPWMGEGLKISTYAWVLDNSVHYWSHTNLMDFGAAVDDHDASANTAVFPNPCDGLFTIDAGPVAGQEVSVEIRDMTGRLVFGPETYSPGMTVSLEQNGIYSVILQDGTSRSSSRIAVCR
jgi:hypothetical protein